jgi:hypothetical protein
MYLKKKKNKQTRNASAQILHYPGRNFRVISERYSANISKLDKVLRILTKSRAVFTRNDKKDKERRTL